MCRTIGALIFSLSYETYSLSGFIYIRDKKSLMLSRVLGALGLLGAILLGHYQFKAFAALPALAVLASVVGVYFLLVAYGYLITGNKVAAKNN